MSALQFSSFFTPLGYGSLVCCIVASAISVWIKTVHRRGKNVHMLVTILGCMVALCLLLPVFLWFRLRTLAPQTRLAGLESWGILLYMLVCGWLMPLSAVVMHWFVASTFSQAKVVDKQSMDPITDQQPASTLQPPRYQSGIVSPYVFREDIPWGWLEYKNGSFQGQRLALKRVVATLGREEYCDIWLDDDMASRHHAELAWHNGQICLTDCSSLNGLLLNGQRIQGTVLVTSNDRIEIGHQHFSLILAEQKDAQADQYDPLVNHTWRSSLDLQAEIDTGGPVSMAPEANSSAMQANRARQTPNTDVALPHAGRDNEADYLMVKNGKRAGQRVILEGPVCTIGRGIECTVILTDLSIARLHAQLVQQESQWYIQDMAGQNNTFLNEDSVTEASILTPGDLIRLGDIQLAYGKMSRLSNTTMPPIAITKTMSGPGPLRLPSRVKPE
ncbi:hypothetical protein KDW_24390 [Dictyobacter vulcani]|uniref:FHA domain-containing protein n=1 Tax=Dictyobacter vulcani TaxID=2607529 RepID=A0A5J4KPB1_9CHLR|nr:FHA domain-containing protein [Dictyobacter vulcani]GER88277.1 hypothetical protein KDW_24390 [Dictyobacter vulcani]